MAGIHEDEEDVSSRVRPISRDSTEAQQKKMDRQTRVWQLLYFFFCSACFSRFQFVMMTIKRNAFHSHFHVTKFWPDLFMTLEAINYCKSNIRCVHVLPVINEVCRNPSCSESNGMFGSFDTLLQFPVSKSKSRSVNIKKTKPFDWIEEGDAHIWVCPWMCHQSQLQITCTCCQAQTHFDRKNVSLIIGDKSLIISYFLDWILGLIDLYLRKWRSLIYLIPHFCLENGRKGVKIESDLFVLWCCCLLMVLN